MKEKGFDYQISEDLIKGFGVEGFYEGNDENVDDTDKAVLQIYKTHGVFPAVKFYKDMSAESLKDSREHVETLLVANGLIKSKEEKQKIDNDKINRLEEKGKKLQKSGCSLMVWGVVIIVVIIIFMLVF